MEESEVWRKRSLRSALTVIVIAFSITLIGCSKISNVKDKDSKEAVNIGNGVSAEEEGKNEEVDPKVKEAKAIEDIKLLSDKVSKTEDIESMLEILDEYYNANSPKVYSAYFVNSEGKLYSSPRDEVDDDLRTRNWYKVAMEGEIYVSEKYEDMVSQKYIITIAKSVIKNDAELGVLAIDKIAE